MYNDERLSEDINEELNRLSADGLPWNATLIANLVCVKYMDGLIEGSDEALFWEHTGRQHTRRKVTHCINRRAGDKTEATDEAQTELLPGYEHLHKYYVVERDGDELGVHVTQLSDSELDGKAAKYRKMGTGCFAHAAELDRFRRTRVWPEEWGPEQVSG
jgi:hypothetical protein